MDVDGRDVGAASCVLEDRAHNTLAGVATYVVGVDSTCGSVDVGEVGHRYHMETCTSCDSLVLLLALVSQTSW